METTKLKEKTCPACGVVGGEGVFYATTLSNGYRHLSSRCKKCHNEYNRQRNLATKGNRKKYPPTESTCTRCGVVGGSDKFSLDPQRKSGLYLYCKACVASQYKSRASEPKTLTQKCKSCGTTGGVDLFPRNGNSKSGLAGKCKQCAAVEARRRRYGRELDARQDPHCEICGTGLEWHSKQKGKSVHVDHCHVTGVIRGVLCSSCNAGLGQFKDNPSLLWKAAVYLGGVRN